MFPELSDGEGDTMKAMPRDEADKLYRILDNYGATGRPQRNLITAFPPQRRVKALQIANSDMRLPDRHERNWH